MEKINVELLDKHKIYLDKYKPNDIYWGIGIENETYLEMSKKYNIDKIDKYDFFLKNAKRERYSIDYFNTSYKNNVFFENLKLIDLPNEIPILLNAHSFSKTDINNQHQTLYTKNPPPNPKFNGKTIFEYLCEKDVYFNDEYMKSYIFDGDTIEFVTNNFYKVTIFDVIQELKNNKKIFIDKVRNIFKENNIFSDYGEIKISENNYPFVTFMTNYGKYCIFNNMTYHFNLTLPTKLNKYGYIEDYNLFKNQHQNAIRLIQLFEPILISVYGSGDILSSVNKNLTNCSQRCAKSRFMGIGTYNSDTIDPGKILLIDLSNNYLTNYENWWFNRYYKISDYKKQDQIGVDINFHKHKNHGIEIRIFHYFNEDQLEKILKFFVLLLDFSLDNKIESYTKNDDWNDLVYNLILNKYYILNNTQKDIYKKLFLLDKDFNTAQELYDIIYTVLLEKYKKNGFCYTKMVNDNIIEDYEIVIEDIVIDEIINKIIVNTVSNEIKNITDNIVNVKNEIKNITDLGLIDLSLNILFNNEIGNQFNLENKVSVNLELENFNEIESDQIKNVKIDKEKCKCCIIL